MSKKVDKELKNEISKFDSAKLNHAETVEKNTLPSPDGWCNSMFI